MSNQLQVFNNQEFGEIRVLEIDGEPWFVGKDVATALGYSNTKDALASHVDDDDKQVLLRSENATLEIPNRGLTIINESGLYSLVLSSKLPGAKRFKRWVTSEILPSIRKHGAYMTPDTIEKIILDPDLIIKLCTELKEERARSTALEAENTVMRPKAVFADAVSATDTDILVRDLAKLLKQNGISIGQNRLFAWLRKNGYLSIMESGHQHNMPTQKAMELGLFRIKETPVEQPNGKSFINKTPLVTVKGQRYFINKFLLMKEKQCVPA